MTIPKPTSRTLVEDELEGAEAWADRRDVELHWEPGRLQLNAELIQPKTGEEFYLAGWFDDYRAIPPRWSFCDAEWEATTAPKFWPERKSGPTGGTLIHNQPVICAPFNRLAFNQKGGPHDDWGQLTEWLDVTGNVTGRTVGDMISSIYRDFRVTEGRMG